MRVARLEGKAQTVFKLIKLKAKLKPNQTISGTCRYTGNPCTVKTCENCPQWRRII